MPAAEPLPSLPSLSPPASAPSPVVLAGGRVIDPASGTDRTADVVISGETVIEVAPGAAQRYPGAEVRDCSGLLVTPGLIDCHTHVFPGFGDFCVHPDRAGVSSGVTTVVDAGTSGTATIEVALHRMAAPDVKTRVLILVDPCRLYLATKDFLPHRLHLADDLNNLDLEAARQVLEEHSDRVVGFKARACTVGDARVSPFLQGAVDVAGDRPVMVHLGSFPYTPSLSTEDTIATLRGGDIVTHAFRGHSGVLRRDGTPLPVFRQRMEEGLFLDVGHSGSDFRFAAARALFDLGYFPTTVSTDLNLFNQDAPVHSVVEVMSKMLALGIALPDVIAMATTGPARVIRRSDSLGFLAAGGPADVSVLRLESGTFALSDGFQTVTTDERLAPVGCLRAGTWYDAEAHAVSPLPVAA